MLIASFVLMSLHRTRAQLHAALTYVGLNLLASAFLLTAIGLLYGQAGTLNFADLARAWPERRTAALDADTVDVVPHRRSASRQACFRCFSGSRPRITRHRRRSVRCWRDC